MQRVRLPPAPPQTLHMIPLCAILCVKDRHGWGDLLRHGPQVVRVNVRATLTSCRLVVHCDPHTTSNSS